MGKHIFKMKDSLDVRNCSFFAMLPYIVPGHPQVGFMCPVFEGQGHILKSWQEDLISHRPKLPGRSPVKDIRKWRIRLIGTFDQPMTSIKNAQVPQLIF